MAREIEALRYMIEAVWDGDRAVGKAKQQIGELGDTTERVAQKSKTNWKAIGAAVAGAGVAIGAIGVAAGKAYQMIGEGADLLRAEGQFGRLAESIDSTADSLMGRLRDATRGMVTDAELMQSATQIMSLGLQDTEDGVTRLTSVAGQLGWDMNQVILTMANNSTMRLDALGLSIEDVQTKAQALEEQGFDADRAFDLAVIEAGEEKIALLGDTADTTAGQMKIMETAVANATDEFKIELARGFTEGIVGISDSATQAASDLQVLTGAVGSFLGRVGGAVIGGAAQAVRNQDTYSKAIEYGIIDEGTKAVDMQGMDIEGLVRRYEALSAASRGTANNFSDVASVNKKVGESARQAAIATDRLISVIDGVPDAADPAGQAMARYGDFVFQGKGNSEGMAAVMERLPGLLQGTGDAAWLAAAGMSAVATDMAGVHTEAKTAEDAIQALNDELDRLSGRNVEAHVTIAQQVAPYFERNEFGGNDQPDPRAIGGPVYANEPYIVGERGPELFVPHGSGNIVPNSQLGGAGGGNTFVFHNREAAAIALTNFGLARRAGLDRRMGVAA